MPDGFPARSALWLDGRQHNRFWEDLLHQTDRQVWALSSIRRPRQPWIGDPPHCCRLHDTCPPVSPSTEVESVGDWNPGRERDQDRLPVSHGSKQDEFRAAPAAVVRFLMVEAAGQELHHHDQTVSSHADPGPSAGSLQGQPEAAVPPAPQPDGFHPAGDR